MFMSLSFNHTGHSVPLLVVHFLYSKEPVVPYCYKTIFVGKILDNNITVY